MLEKLLFDKSLQKIKFIFRLTGLNIDNKKRNFKQNFIFSFNLLWDLTDIVFTLLWFVNGISNGVNFTELTYVAPCTTNGILAGIKVLFLFIKEKEVHSLMDNLRDLETKSNDFVNPERENLIKPEIKLLNVVITVLNILNGLLIVLFAIKPLFWTGIKYLTTGEVELLLPFLDVYPFDSSDLRYWPFVYIHQAWSVCLVLVKVMAADFFFFTCCTHIKIQFRLLQHQFREIIAERSIRSMNSIDHIAVRAHFKELIKWHQEIISSANMLEGIYGKSTLFNFFSASLVICLTGFQVTIADDKGMVVSFLIFLFMSMLQVFFVCFFGENLMSSSIEVAGALYNNRWYLSDVLMRRNVLLVQTRAQDPCKLTAAGFADVNLRAYMKIMSTAWSYFALLQTIYGSRS